MEVARPFRRAGGETHLAKAGQGAPLRPLRAPRGALGPCGDERAPPPSRRSGSVKLRAARSLGRGGERQAALTTPGRASTVRWSGSGKQDGKAYVRNQRLNAPQETHQLEPDGSGLGSSVHPHHGVRGTLRPVRLAGREAMVKSCGVAVAMLQGHSWAPTPSNGPRVNVGTILAVPSPASSQLVGGTTRRRSMPPGWDGGPVVVRAQESCAHGEGVQRVRSINAERGGRW